MELLAVHDSTDYRPGAEARKQGSNGQLSNLLCGSTYFQLYGSKLSNEVEKYFTVEKHDEEERKKTSNQIADNLIVSNQVGKYFIIVRKQLVRNIQLFGGR